MTESPLDLAALVRRHQRGLWRYLRSLGAPPDVAEDLLQDTFLVAIRRLQQDRGEAAVATFLRAIAKHLWLRRHRDQSRREVLLAEHLEAQWGSEQWRSEQLASEQWGSEVWDSEGASEVPLGRQPVPGDDGVDAPIADGERADGETWIVALRHCVAGLDGRTRDVVQRFYGDGDDRQTVATALGMKETGVKTLLQRVRALLRDCVQRRLRGEA